MRKSTMYLFVLGLAIVVMAGLTCAGFVVSAQNMNMTANTESKPKPKHRKKAPVSTGRCDNTKQEQTDLSGTYTGKLTHGDQATDATITISGSSITVNAGSETHSGTIVAETTCGYTAVAIVMTGGEPGKQIDAASLRAKKVGDKLTLTSVPGEPKKIMFTTGGMTKPKPRKHKAKAKSAATTTPTPKQ